MCDIASIRMLCGHTVTTQHGRSTPTFCVPLRPHNIIMRAACRQCCLALPQYPCVWLDAYQQLQIVRTRFQLQDLTNLYELHEGPDCSLVRIVEAMRIVRRLRTDAAVLSEHHASQIRAATMQRLAAGRGSDSGYEDD